jgi:hypothetical protein
VRMEVEVRGYHGVPASLPSLPAGVLLLLCCRPCCPPDAHAWQPPACHPSPCHSHCQSLCHCCWCLRRWSRCCWRYLRSSCWYQICCWSWGKDCAPCLACPSCPCPCLCLRFCPCAPPLPWLTPAWRGAAHDGREGLLRVAPCPHHLALLACAPVTFNHVARGEVSPAVDGSAPAQVQGVKTRCTGCVMLMCCNSSSLQHAWLC